MSNSANEDWFNLLTPKAIEIGLSSEKVGWDGGISINEKSINLNKKYQQLSD